MTETMTRDAMNRADLECARVAREMWPGRHFTVYPGRMTDAGYSWPVAIPAPDGWVPRGYHVTVCEACGEVTEPYSSTEPRIVHRATGWAMCAPNRRGTDPAMLPPILRGLADQITVIAS